MREREVFGRALGLEWPWRVERVEFDAEAKRLDLQLDFERGGTFRCPACGRSGCKAHDTTEKSWRHLNFYQHRTFLHARVPRVKCPACGVKQVEVPWARPESGFTLWFEAFVMALVKEMPVRAAGRLVGEHDTRLWRVLKHYVEEARGRADFSEVRAVGLDETACRRGHDYITLFATWSGRGSCMPPRVGTRRCSRRSGVTWRPTAGAPSRSRSCAWICCRRT